MSTDTRPDRTTMEGMIWNANHVLDMALDPNSKGIPRDLLEGCKGVALISVVELGFVFSGTGGTGVILARGKDKKWSPPSAIGMGGVGFGALFGAAIKDVLVLLIDDESVQAMAANNQIKLGGEIGVAIGPVGREMEGQFNFSGKGAGMALTYTFSKGLFGGAGVEGAVLRGRGKENERFYGQPATPTEILLEGKVTAPEGKGIEDLHRKLELMRRGKTLVPTDEEKETKEKLRAEAEEAGKAAKADQGDEVEHVDAEAKAAEEGKAAEVGK